MKIYDYVSASATNSSSQENE